MDSSQRSVIDRGVNSPTHHFDSDQFDSPPPRYVTKEEWTSEDARSVPSSVERSGSDDNRDGRLPRAIHNSHMQMNIQEPSPIWQPKGLRGAPWLGIGGLFVTFAAAVAIIAVSLSANGKETNRWPSKDVRVQLAVALAVLIAVGNAGLTLAFSEGVTLAWWVKMLKGGTLYDSHRYWEHGSSAVQSLLEVRNFNKVSLASVMVLILLITGPLLQRAAGQTTVVEREVATFNATLSPDAFTQATGYYMTHAPAVNALSQNFSTIVQDFTSRTSIKLGLTGCNGTCLGTLIAPGFDANCTTGTQKYDLGMDKLDFGNETTVGSISVYAMGTMDPDIMTLSTLYKPEASIKGNLISTNCTLHIGQVKYKFHETNGTLTLDEVDQYVNSTVARLYMRSEMTGLGSPMPSVLGGIAYAANNIYGSDVSLYRTTIYSVQGTGPMSYTYMNSTQAALGTTNMTWTDPTSYVLGAIRELTFRTAIAFSNSSSHQSVQGTLDRTATKYRLHPGFIGGALAIQFITALTILWLFEGFWLLGRRVSMSPLEIAAAFQAPIMAQADVNAEAHRLAKQVGEQKARYGVIELNDESYQNIDGRGLAIAAPSMIRQ